MTKSTLLAFDPAAEVAVSDTGYALFEYTADAPPTFVQSGVIHGGFEGFSNWLRTTPLEADTVVCEQFIHYNAAADISPLLIEGAIRSYYKDVVLQPSSALGMVSEAQIKALNMWSEEGHHADANSATRHAIFYLRSVRHTPTLRLLSQF